LEDEGLGSSMKVDGSQKGKKTREAGGY